MLDLAALLEELDRHVAVLLAQCEIHGPPVDALQVARRLELDVAVDRRLQGRARCVRFAQSQRADAQATAVPTRSRSARKIADGANGLPRATILLRPEPRPERRQWAIAHEIGEQLVPGVLLAAGWDQWDTPAELREQLANQFATRLLLPQAWFLADAQAAGWCLRALKCRYPTASHELIARRMLDCPPPIVISIFDNGRLQFRRHNTGGRLPPLSSAETTLARQLDHEGGQLERANVQGLAIHEPGWRRQILRLESPEQDWEYE